MATQIQFRRGSKSQHNTFTGAEGEVTVNTTNDSLHVHDGVTAGGFELAKSDLSNHQNVGVLTATTFSGNLANTLNLATSGTGLSGSATFNNSGVSTFTVASNATATNTPSTIVARDASGNFSAGIVTVTKARVGSATTFSEDLVVQGNARVTGILTVGTSSIILDGDNNQIKIGSNVTLSETGSTTFNDGINVNGIVTATQFSTGSGSLGINTNTIFGPANITIDPAGVGDNTGTVTIKGNLQIDGTTTTINSTELVIDDKNITLASGAIDDAAADGGGITIESGEGNKTFQFNDASNSFKSNISLEVSSGQVYKINNTEVLSSTTLGSGITNSSLTSVGTLISLNVGNLYSTGIVTATTFVGNLTGVAASATQLVTPRTFEITGDIVASPISFDGTGNVSLAATIQPNSVALGDDTTGNYVASISNGNYITGGNGGSENAILTIGVAATSTNTADQIVARDASGDFSASTITANLTGTATTASNLSDAANITTGTINSSRLTGSYNIDITGNAASATYASTAGIATALQNSRTFEITGDIVASPISFDGTGNVSLAATIQPNSVALGSDTTGDYVQTITGTNAQITVTSGTGEGSTPTLSIPSQFTAPQDVTVTRDLQVNRNLNVNGNITIGGTAATLFTTEFKVYDPDIVLGFRTDGNGNDVSNDNTANHGGIAIASTEGNPLVQLYDVGIGETNPATYKKIMWFKANTGSFTGLGTDAWLFNYAVGIGSTQFPTGTRLAAGNVQFTQNDLAVVRNINASGIVTATSINKVAITAPATSATLTIADGKTLTASNTLTFSGTDSSSIAFGSGGTVAYTSNKLSAFSTTTSSELAGVITDETGSGSLVFATSPTLTTPKLGVATATSIVVSSAVTINSSGVNATGIITATTFSGSGASLTGVPVSTGISGLGANVATFLATPSSANLISAVTDETGSGSLVFATSPTLTTPNLGTPSAGTLTNCSGLPITGITSSTTIGLGVGSIELGNATDTTITRVSAGRIAVEGVNVVTIASTDTLTNKTLTSPVISTIVNTGTLTLPTSTDTLVGRATTDTLTNKTINLSSNTLSFTSAQLVTACTDETGSGSLVFATSPTLVTPILGSATATSVVVGSAVTINSSGVNATGIITASDGFNIGIQSGGVNIATGSVKTLNFVGTGNTFLYNASTKTVDISISGGGGGSLSISTSTSSTVQDIAFVGGAGTSVIGIATATNRFVYLPSSGNLGIGTTNPTSKLHVIGDAIITGVVTATDFNSTSDYNLKTNIKTIENSLDTIVQLRGVTFDWKDSGKPSIGIVAQELSQVLPELVTDTDPKTVNYNGLIGVLIEGMKKQQEQINDLRKEINLLKNQT